MSDKKLVKVMLAVEAILDGRERESVYTGDAKMDLVCLASHLACNLVGGEATVAALIDLLRACYRVAKEQAHAGRARKEADMAEAYDRGRREARGEIQAACGAKSDLCGHSITEMDDGSAADYPDERVDLNILPLPPQHPRGA